MDGNELVRMVFSGLSPLVIEDVTDEHERIIRQNGDTNIAAALRRTGRDHTRPLQALGLT
ncbi:hypothetical protein ACH4YO_42480 [Streptomyces noursei]|uniref:hypothetical protein n=1 Tax=Streptomyces noursei TaxID=1971 RepID=UPI0033DA2158